MSQQPALLVEKLSLTINNNPILEDIGFSLNRGEILGVLGPNGAGKTSLLRLLSGQRNSLGHVSWLGTPLSSLCVQEIARKIAVVNQINDPVFALTLLHVVRMGLLPHKTFLARQTREDDSRIQNAINAVGLQDKVNQEFSSLSGGEQQRALIARALVQGAPLLVLDEPVNHLDVYYQHQILQLLRQLSQHMKITVVMSLHDLNLAATYCDKLCLLNKGKLSAFGPVEQVLQSKLLSQVFGLPCQVEHDDEIQRRRVEFIPDDAPLLKFDGWQQ